MVGIVLKGKRAESISVHEFLEDVRSSRMVGICVGITLDVYGHTRIRKKDVFHYHRQDSHHYCPFLLTSACWQIYTNVSSNLETRNV